MLAHPIPGPDLGVAWSASVAALSAADPGESSPGTIHIIGSQAHTLEWLSWASDRVPEQLVAIGALWIGFGMFVLTYQVGSLVAVATFVGVAFLFGGITQLVVASRVPGCAGCPSSAESWG